MNFDAFRTISEISVTLTGFIGIVIVLQHRDKSFSQLGLFTILATTLGAALFGFLPDLLSGLFDATTTWRISCGVFGFYHLFLILYHQFKQKVLRSNTPVQWLIVVLSFPVAGLKIVVGFGYLLSYAYEIYYLGLLWCVGIAGYLFAMILFDKD